MKRSLKRRFKDDIKSLKEIDNQLSIILKQLREGSSEVLNSFDSLVEKLDYS